VTQGISVQTGDVIGYAACEGGFSTATHLHIGRRYNGEWLPAYCHACPADLSLQPFVMSGWSVIGLRNQEYQGFLRKGGEQRTAEQGRTSPINRVSW
jgi:murein DD-endopeptidase MepM/ murein hydrolase activator NlpD